ncbi:MAG: matrixin family metalloprotease [Amaricoccus sp.]
MPSLLSRLELTWFCKNMPSRTDLKVGDVLDEIFASFSDWQAVTPFRFSEAADGVPADFQIVFGSVGQSDAGGQYDGNSSGGTITLDDRRTWSSFRDRLKSQTSAGSNPLSLPLSVVTKLEDAFNDGSRVDLRSILLHEIGHAILGGNGNEDHSTAPHSVMAETVTPDTMYYSGPRYHRR